MLCYLRKYDFVFYLKDLFLFNDTEQFRCHINLSLSAGQAKYSRLSISDEVKLLMDSVSHRLGLSSREHILDFLVASRDIFGKYI